MGLNETKNVVMLRGNSTPVTHTIPEGRTATASSRGSWSYNVLGTWWDIPANVEVRMAGGQTIKLKGALGESITFLYA